MLSSDRHRARIVKMVELPGMAKIAALIRQKTPVFIANMKSHIDFSHENERNKHVFLF